MESPDNQLCDLNPETLTRASECLRTLAHPVRLMMIHLLLEGRYTVGELSKICNVQSNVASEHLRLMERCGFLKRNKEGRKCYYEVIEPQLAGIINCIRNRYLNGGQAS